MSHFNFLTRNHLRTSIVGIFSCYIINKKADVIKQYYCIVFLFLNYYNISKQLAGFITPLFRCSCIISDCTWLDVWCY